jgi:hypothetical protein
MNYTGSGKAVDGGGGQFFQATGTETDLGQDLEGLGAGGQAAGGVDSLPRGKGSRRSS